MDGCQVPEMSGVWPKPLESKPYSINELEFNPEVKSVARIKPFAAPIGPRC
ncbi:MAG: hypothetical protein CM15mP8_2440 [Methanobacteriota archaeon]|nr:MAG: hypothetical protein CM15mP8_2440 [Euryarchaeota archaeon]